MSGVEKELTQKLSDPDFFKTLGDVGQPALDKVKEGLEGLPGVVRRDFLNSEFKLVIADPEAWAEAMQEHDIKPEDIEKFKKMGGYASPSGAELNACFDGKPHIVIFKRGEELSRMPHTTRHEVGHALDHINAEYKGFFSQNSDFKEAYEKYESTEKTDQPYHGQDWTFTRHKRHYEQYEHPVEAVAEMMQKYSALCYKANRQVAERVMTHGFPFIWDALKEDMPQIGQSLERYGLDINARPVRTAPEDILTHKYLHRGEEEFELHISVHGLSANETQAVEDVLKEKGLHPRNDTVSDKAIYSSLVIPVEEVEKFKAIRKEMIQARLETVLQIDPQAIDAEEYRVAEGLFPNVTLLFQGLALAQDGTLIMKLSDEYDIDELASQIGVDDLSEKDRIKTSAPDTQTLAIAFNRLPTELRANLVPAFNKKSGHGGSVTSEHSPDEAGSIDKIEL